MLMHLQNADGPHLCNGALNGSLQSAGLVVTVNEDHYLASRHYGAYTYGKSGGGNLLHVVVEEA